MLVKGATGDRYNIKMPSYQYRDPHDNDKTVSLLSYLYIMEIPIPWKMVFKLRRALGPIR